MGYRRTLVVATLAALSTALVAPACGGASGDAEPADVLDGGAFDGTSYDVADATSSEDTGMGLDTASAADDTAQVTDTASADTAVSNDTEAPVDTVESSDTTASDTTASDTTASDTTESSDTTDSSDTTEPPADTVTDTGPEGVHLAEGPDGEQVVVLSDAVAMDLLEIPAGAFIMGCEAGRDDLGETCHSDETPSHGVILTRAYWLGRSEVTQEQFAELMGYDPSDNFGRDGACADCPVDSVSWSEAAAYANALSDALGFAPCYACEGEGSAVVCQRQTDPYSCEGYRLPTEAEWERAARGGSSHMYPGANTLDAVAWHSGNSAIDGSLQTHPVCGLFPNAYGLCDMGGNVWEWVNDQAHDISYPDETVTDPVGADNDSTDKRIRGGSFWVYSHHQRCANRAQSGWIYFASNETGFRLARTVPAP